MAPNKEQVNSTPATPPTLDCGDNSCYFATSKGGMRTNGGCRCFSAAGFNKGTHAAAREMLLEVLRLRAECAQLNTAVTLLKECIKAVSPTALTLVEIELASLRSLQDFVDSVCAAPSQRPHSSDGDLP